MLLNCNLKANWDDLLNIAPKDLYSFQVVEEHNLGDKVTFKLKLLVKDGWFIHSNIKQENTNPFKVHLHAEPKVAKQTIYWPKNKLKKEDMFGMAYEVSVFDSDILIPVELELESINDTFVAHGKVFFTICNNSCIPVEETFHLKIPIDLEGKSSSNLEYIIFMLSIASLAFIGGVILNFMPCVLPVISLKVYSLLNTLEKYPKRIRLECFLTTVGILITFMILAGVSIIIKLSGNYVGWGMHFQEPWFVVFLIIVLLLFSLNMLGLFNIALSSKLNDVLYKLNYKGAFNSVLIGFTTTLLATPCLAPFLGTALAFALSQSVYSILSVYFLIGLGMSLPYLLIVIKPSLLRFLPKPGAWMEGLKKVFALLLGLTIIWLLYILFAQVTLNFFSNIIGLIFVILAFFMIRSNFYKIWLIIATVICLVGVLILHFKPLIYNKEISYNWEDYSEARLEQLLDSNQKVFVYVTADWCITCKINEYRVLNTKQTEKLFFNNNVKMLRADYTSRSDEISSYLQKHGAYGVPVYIYYNRDNKQGIKLPVIISYQDLEDLF